MKYLIITLILFNPPTFEEKLQKRAKENRIEFNQKHQQKIDSLTSPNKFYRLMLKARKDNKE